MDNYPAGVSDADPYFTDESETQEKGPQPRVCRNCDGTGIAGYATREMALDAGDTQLEGIPVICSFCVSGWVIE